MVPTAKRAAALVLAKSMELVAPAAEVVALPLPVFPVEAQGFAASRIAAKALKAQEVRRIAEVSASQRQVCAE